MPGLHRFGGDMHRAHPHRVRLGEVADVVLEHRGGPGFGTVAGEDRLEGGALGLWREIRMLDAVDRVERRPSPRALST